MSNLSFTEEDKQKLVEFLNMNAKHAKFELNTNELIQYFKLLSHMQKQILPKVEANILEVKRVIENKDVVPEATNSAAVQG